MKKSLFGYANTTKALSQNGEIWDIYDDKFSQISKDEFGNTLLPVSEFDPNLSQLEIPSPGFPPSHTLVQNSRNLISEYDYFKDEKPTQIWISGTNGKTTTTQMTQSLLESYGSVAGGNIGTPLANLDKNAKIWILETSSFTLHYTKFATPNLYALLPITKDHLSWHGSYENYEKAKLKPLEMMGEDCVAILPAVYKDIKTKATTIFYENEFDLAKFCKIELSDIVFKPPFLLDALLALSIEKVIFDRANVEKINKFKIDTHKLEEMKDSKNRLWVNDTKATNIDAALQAINRYEKSFLHIILGGDDKGVEFDELFARLQNVDCKLYLIGTSTKKFADLSKKFKIEFDECFELKFAVAKINESLKINEIALLSPACASLDQFKSYAHRGDEFKNLVKNI